MDLSIRPITSDELRPYLAAMETSFGSHLDDEELERVAGLFELDRSLAAFEGSRIVGTAGAFSLTLTTPGGSTPMAGVTGVGVLPTHRRQRVLTSLMRRQLDDLRDHGEAVAGLWASEGSIYGRFGYGAAVFATQFEIARERTAFLRPSPDTGRIVLAEREEAMKVLPEVYERIRPTRAGMLDRSPPMWEDHLSDSEHHRQGASRYFFAIHETAGAVDGYVVYRTKQDWSDGTPRGTVHVREVVAESVATYAALWRYCFDIDLMARTEAWGGPVDEPLLLMLVEPRHLRLRIAESLYVRPVDVARMLRSRRYAAEGSFTFELHDPFCPWTEGRYRLTAGPDGADCDITDGSADIRLSAEELGAVFLGGVGFRALGRAGRLDEDTPGALATADAMFATDPPPWCAHTF